MGFFGKLFGKGGKTPPNPADPPPDRPGLGLDELARRVGVGADALRQLPVAYREVTIKKRHGGLRKLNVPADPLKTMQRTILRKLLARLSAHDAARGFERGQSIVTNARPHVGKPVILKMDLKNFFPTTTAARVERYFRIAGWGKEASALLTRLCTYDDALPQGAPTSPRLSNLVNYAMDARLAALAAAIGAVYTRYADDMTFSFDEQSAVPDPRKEMTKASATPPRPGAVRRSAIAAVIRCTKEIVGEYGYKLHQDRKLQIRRRYDSQRVTGLVVNERLALPRERRRWLRAVAHHMATGRPTTVSPEQFAGWLAFRNMVEQAGRDSPAA